MTNAKGCARAHSMDPFSQPITLSQGELKSHCEFLTGTQGNTGVHPATRIQIPAQTLSLYTELPKVKKAKDFHGADVLDTQHQVVGFSAENHLVWTMKK